MAVMMDGDDGIEQKDDSEDLNKPSKMSLIMMAENDDDSYDNFDDDNNGNKPGNSAGHEPHSVSPLRVVGGTIAPWMVITVIFIGVVIIVMMVIVNMVQLSVSWHQEFEELSNEM